MHYISIHKVHPYSSVDTVTTWKKPVFILSDWQDVHMIDNQSIPIQAFDRLYYHHFITPFSRWDTAAEVQEIAYEFPVLVT